MTYKIITDSSSNLHEFSGIDYACVPLTINTDEREFVDSKDLDVKEMVDYLSTYKGKSGSACPSVAAYLDSFGDADRVFVITITGTLSGSCNAARLAKEDYEADYPDRKVFVIDSLSAGPELKLIAEKLKELIDSGMDFDEICTSIMAYKEKTGLVFCLENLTNLANNGRINPAVAKIAGMIGIRICGTASPQGELDPSDKCRGEKKATAGILGLFAKHGYAGGKVIIDHCYNETYANTVKEAILKNYPEADIRFGKTYGLCSFYAEKGGLMIGFEKK